MYTNNVFFYFYLMCQYKDEYDQVLTFFSMLLILQDPPWTPGVGWHVMEVYGTTASIG